MKDRDLAALVTAIAMLWFVPSSAVGQETAATSLRTPWGDPDLQGVWSNVTITPLERPSELASKAVLTEDEAADFERRAAEDRVDRPPRPGDTGTYNRFWTDRGTKVVATRRTSLLVDPPDGRLPPLTPDGLKREARGTDSWEDRNLWERCVTRGLPNAMLPSGYNSNYRILQTPEHVVIRIEMLDTRIISLDERPYVGPHIPQWMGDSRGHWEGDTLVLTTLNFADKISALQRWNQFKPASGVGGALRVIERFTRVDQDTIDYQMTVEDPKTYLETWTVAYPFLKNPEELFEYACHEGNHGMQGILAGARAQEKTEAATTH